MHARTVRSSAAHACSSPMSAQMCSATSPPLSTVPASAPDSDPRAAAMVAPARGGHDERDEDALCSDQSRRATSLSSESACTISQGRVRAGAARFEGRGAHLQPAMWSRPTSADREPQAVTDRKPRHWSRADQRPVTCAVPGPRGLDLGSVSTRRTTVCRQFGVARARGSSSPREKWLGFE